MTNLDDILDRLEGAIYERDIFLQYELGKLASTAPEKIVFSGEGADQLFNVKTWEGPAEDPWYIYWKTDPYSIAANILFKKNRLMLNSFGKNVRYPYLTPQMLRVGFLTRKENSSAKEFHKAQCKHSMPPVMMKFIGKHGGSTDIISMFPERFNCKSELEKRKYYDASFDIRNVRSLAHLRGEYESMMDYYVSLLYLESFENQFCDHA